jgi:hypothetical protein
VLFSRKLSYRHNSAVARDTNITVVTREHQSILTSFAENVSGQKGGK